MFANIFFLFLVLLILGSIPENSSTLLFQNAPDLALLVCLGIYALLLSLIWLQNKFLAKKISGERLIFLGNIELLAFFIGSYFVIGAQRFFQQPMWSPFNLTFLSIFTLTLYFGGLFLIYYQRLIPHFGNSYAKDKAASGIRFLFPFTLPFLVLVVLGDLFSLLPYKKILQLFHIIPNSIAEQILVGGISLLALLGTMILLPAGLVYLWKCHPLKDPVLVPRLEALCQRADFKHAGFKVWTVMEGSFNAAIIGIVSYFRYIMFTPKLISRLSPEAIEAILAHEIGHNRRKHLLLYPLILFGMIVSGWIASIYAYQLLQPSPESEPLVLFLSFAVCCAVYFRLVFGYFSRLFERQADLYIFEVGIPPQSMIEALNEIGHAAGGIHNEPSWHHYSIQQRIDFLNLCEEHPTIIPQHHRKVYLSLLVYLFILIMALTYFNL